ncbi:hypothetical protein CWR48_18015 [Oceanobacillus arenosus]|uniref:Uncharacterized protein n=1 Tax=Oceanobacillus arenosus TaxID=1229153 RepID=A0A3D8PLG7_9BACI|nr:hypothetical protein [Oceanobacillus arenosus]RDW16081.1 hypothetical protein CWR48_18015 [Oceanobacillus arenosus]
MNVMDAKVINTKYGLEMYVDDIQSVEIKEVHSPTIENPFYEVRIGVEFLLMKDQKYFNKMENDFWISMSPDFQSVKIKETEKKNIFALKNDKEKEATRELVGEWLIKTDSYKHAIMERINQQADMKNDLSNTDYFLKNLLYLDSNDIKDALIEHYN